MPRNSSTGGRGGGWRLRLVAVAGRGAADRSVGSDLARARGPGSLTGLPRFFRSVAHGGRGCNPGAEGLERAAGAGGGLRAGRCRMAGHLRLRGDDLPIFVRGATARAEPVRRGESRPSRRSSSAAGVRTSRGGDDTSDSKTLPETIRNEPHPRTFRTLVDLDYRYPPPRLQGCPPPRMLCTLHTLSRAASVHAHALYPAGDVPEYNISTCILERLTNPTACIVVERPL